VPDVIAIGIGMKREDFFDLCGQPPRPAHGSGSGFMLYLLFHPADKV